MKIFGGLRKGDTIKISAKVKSGGEHTEIYKTRQGYVYSIYPEFIVFAFPYQNDTGTVSEFKESFTTFQFRGINIVKV